MYIHVCIYVSMYIVAYVYIIVHCSGIIDCIGITPGGSGGAMDPPLFSWSFSLTRYNAHARITHVSRKAVV